MNTIRRYVTSIGRYLRNNRAVSALEYAVLVGVVVAGVGAAVATFTDDITALMEDLGKTISEAEAPKSPELE